MEDFEKDSQIEYNREKKALITKFVVSTIIISIIVAVISSEFTLYYYYKTNNKYTNKYNFFVFHKISSKINIIYIN